MHRPARLASLLPFAVASACAPPPCAETAVGFVVDRGIGTGAFAVARADEVDADIVLTLAEPDGEDRPDTPPRFRLVGAAGAFDAPAVDDVVDVENACVPKGEGCDESWWVVRDGDGVLFEGGFDEVVDAGDGSAGEAGGHLVVDAGAPTAETCARGAQVVDVVAARIVGDDTLALGPGETGDVLMGGRSFRAGVDEAWRATRYTPPGCADCSPGWHTTTHVAAWLWRRAPSSP